MDELLRFKEIWDTVRDQNGELNQPDTSLMIRKRSNRIAVRFRRSLLLEILLCIAVIPVFTWYFLENAKTMNSYMLFFLIVMLIACAVYYYLKYREFGRMEPPAGFNIKQSLEMQLKWMRAFVRIYLRLNLSMLGFCLIMIMMLGIDSLLYTLQEVTGLHQLVISAVILLVAFVITLAAYPLLKLYIYGMFGRYIRQLESGISELEENGS